MTSSPSAVPQDIAMVPQEALVMHETEPVSKPTPRVPIQHRARTGETPRSPSPSFSLRRAVTGMLTPEEEVGKTPGVWVSLKAAATVSWLNILLVFIPISWITHFVLDGDRSKDIIIFVFSFLAIIPLAKLIGFATEQLSLRVGQTLARTLNAVLGGNTVEFTGALIALTKCETTIVRSSLVGSILANLLFVLGACFMVGGIKYQTQTINRADAQIDSSLLMLSIIPIVLLTASSLTLTVGPKLLDSVDNLNPLKASRGIAIVLLIIYVSRRVFLLRSHSFEFLPVEQDQSLAIPNNAPSVPTRHREENSESISRTQERNQSNSWLQASPLENGGQSDNSNKVVQPELALSVAVALLIVVIAISVVCHEILVGAMDGLNSTGGIDKEFIGVILLPFAWNTAERIRAITSATKDNDITLAFRDVVNSSIRTMLFVIPLIVIIAWCIGKDLTLFFDPYEVVALFLTVITVNFVIQDNESNAAEGFMLVMLYIILGITFWFYPGTEFGC